MNEDGFLIPPYQRIQHYHPGENISRCHYSSPGFPIDRTEISSVSPHRDDDKIGTSFMECVCGFYSVWDPDNRYGVATAVDPYFPGRNSVFGVIDGYGRVAIGPHGARLEKAKVGALHLPRGLRITKGLREKYPEARIYETRQELIDAENISLPQHLFDNPETHGKSSYG